MRAAIHKFMPERSSRPATARSRWISLLMALALSGAQLAPRATVGQARAEDELFDPDADFDPGDSADQVGDEGDGENSEDANSDDDPFAYEEPEALTAVRGRIAVGAGPGWHSQEVPRSQVLQSLSSGALPVLEVSADVDTAALNELGAGARFSYASTVGQTASIESTPGVVVESAARQQAVRAEIYLRIPLGDSERPMTIPLFLGAGYTGFNTDEPLPVMESTLFDLHLRPALRIPMGEAFELELGPEAGVVIAVMDDLPSEGISEFGFALGADVIFEGKMSEAFAVRVSGRFRQIAVPEAAADRYFVSSWYFATVGLAGHL